jgi:hypothetical protein
MKNDHYVISKTLTKAETEILDVYITQNYNEFNECVFNHSMSNTFPGQRSEYLYSENVAFTDYVVKLQQSKI